VQAAGADYDQALNEAVYHEAREAAWMQNVYLQNKAVELAGKWQELGLEKAPNFRQMTARMAHIIAASEQGLKARRETGVLLAAHHLAEIGMMDFTGDQISNLLAEDRRLHNTVLEWAAEQEGAELSFEEASEYQEDVRRTLFMRNKFRNTAQEAVVLANNIRVEEDWFLKNGGKWQERSGEQVRRLLSSYLGTDKISSYEQVLLERAKSTEQGLSTLMENILDEINSAEIKGVQELLLEKSHPGSANNYIKILEGEREVRGLMSRLNEAQRTGLRDFIVASARERLAAETTPVAIDEKADEAAIARVGVVNLHKGLEKMLKQAVSRTIEVYADGDMQNEAAAQDYLKARGVTSMRDQTALREAIAEVEGRTDYKTEIAKIETEQKAKEKQLEEERVAREEDEAEKKKIEVADAQVALEQAKRVADAAEKKGVGTELLRVHSGLAKLIDQASGRMVAYEDVSEAAGDMNIAENYLKRRGITDLKDVGALQEALGAVNASAEYKEQVQADQARSLVRSAEAKEIIALAGSGILQNIQKAQIRAGKMWGKMKAQGYNAANLTMMASILANLTTAASKLRRGRTEDRARTLIDQLNKDVQKGEKEYAIAGRRLEGVERIEVARDEVETGRIAEIKAAYLDAQGKADALIAAVNEGSIDIATARERLSQIQAGLDKLVGGVSAAVLKGEDVVSAVRATRSSILNAEQAIQVAAARQEVEAETMDDILQDLEGIKTEDRSKYLLDSGIARDADEATQLADVISASRNYHPEFRKLVTVEQLLRNDVSKDFLGKLNNAYKILTMSMGVDFVDGNMMDRIASNMNAMEGDLSTEWLSDNAKISEKLKILSDEDKGAVAATPEMQKMIAFYEGIE
ncbi:MAG: hypothetical protein WBD12_03565, partial [Candidatus Omnitrophota bacterium]